MSTPSWVVIEDDGDLHNATGPDGGRGPWLRYWAGDDKINLDGEVTIEQLEWLIAYMKKSVHHND